ncbi:MAG: hypothetical protein KJ648_07500 [Candidatus Omnitrophica bacterium]|nr:hypothetical protein [Candidatus Omnitrophota bacterium]
MKQIRLGLYQFGDRLIMRARHDWIVWTLVTAEGQARWREERRFPLTVTAAGIVRDLLAS